MAFLARPAVYEVAAAASPPAAANSVIRAGNATSTATSTPQHYTQDEIDQMLAGTKNSYDLKKLIQCESQNTNIARMDSNGLISFGVLQFNGTSTWATFAPLADVFGSPMNPPDAIKVADWMISHGFIARWTCARIQKLL